METRTEEEENAPQPAAAASLGTAEPPTKVAGTNEIKKTIEGLVSSLRVFEASPSLPGIIALVTETKQQLKEAKERLRETKPLKTRLTNTDQFFERERARLKALNEEVGAIEAKRLDLMDARAAHEATIAN